MKNRYLFFFATMIFLCSTNAITGASKQPIIKNNIAYYDGCTAEGDPCECSNIQDTECKQGLCFKGDAYGQEAVYCQCHHNVMNNEEIEALKKKLGGTIPTDQACGLSRPALANRHNVENLFKELINLVDKNQFFMRGNPQVNEKARSVLLSTKEQVLKELDALYGFEKTEDVNIASLLRIYESNNPKEACDHVKWIITNRLSAQGANWKLSPTTNRFISLFCKQQVRSNGDPCFCNPEQPATARKPGICQVNKCVDPDKLRCHCD